ncbi:unnamed protein product, partial [Symbiodinium sp. CCMP2456]
LTANNATFNVTGIKFDQETTTFRDASESDEPGFGTWSVDYSYGGGGYGNEGTLPPGGPPN